MEAELTFTDDQVQKAFGLHIDNVRRLITWRAVTPAQGGGGRGKVRKWSLKSVQRMSITTMFHDMGLSLKLAHTLTTCLPIEHTIDHFNRRFFSYEHAASTIRNALMTDVEWSIIRETNGSTIIIVDNELVYGDLCQQKYNLFGRIFRRDNKYISTWNPYTGLRWDPVKQINIPCNQEYTSSVDPASLAFSLWEERFREVDMDGFDEDPTELSTLYTTINLNAALLFSTRGLLRVMASDTGAG